MKEAEVTLKDLLEAYLDATKSGKMEWEKESPSIITTEDIRRNDSLIRMEKRGNGNEFHLKFIDKDNDEVKWEHTIPNPWLPYLEERKDLCNKIWKEVHNG